MAGDWLKMESSTPFKPEMAILSTTLNVTLGEAFLNFFKVYRWLDGATADGVVPNLSLPDVDKLSGALPGTCAALASPRVGWLGERDGAIHVSNWDRHNGKSAKQRVYEREKKRRQRSESRERPDKAGTAAGTSNGTQRGLIEKRIEEKNTASAVTPLPPLPAILDGDDFRRALIAWLAYKGRRKATSPAAIVSRAEKRAAAHGVGAVIDAMERARANGWQGWDQDSSFSNGNGNGHTTTKPSSHRVLA